MQANRTLALQVAYLQHVLSLDHADIFDAKNRLTVYKLAVNVVVVQANKVRNVSTVVALDQGVAAPVQDRH